MDEYNNFTTAKLVAGDHDFHKKWIATWDHDAVGGPSWSSFWGNKFNTRRNPFTCVYYRDYSFMNDTLPGQDLMERGGLIDSDATRRDLPSGGGGAIAQPVGNNELIYAFRPPRVQFADFIRGYTTAIPLTYQFKASTFGFDQAA